MFRNEYYKIFKASFSNRAPLVAASAENYRIFAFNTRHTSIMERFAKTLQKQPPELFCEKGVLRNFTKFTGKHLHQSLFFKKEAMVHVLSCEFCKISENTFSSRTTPVAASNILYSLYYIPSQIFDRLLN